MQYKVVYKRSVGDTGDDVLWEPGCPLLFSAVQVARNVSTGQAFLQGRVANTSNRLIGSFVAETEVRYGDSSREVVKISSLDADIEPEGSFAITPIQLSQGDVSNVTVRVLEAGAGDSAWVSERNPEPVPSGDSYGFSDEALQERFLEIWGSESAVDRTAADRRVVSNGDWWVCGCGFPNVMRAECARCGASLERQNDANLANEECLTEAHRKRVADEARVESKRKRRNKCIAVAVIVLFLIAAASVPIAHYVIVPATEQAEYEKALEEKQAKYDRAVALMDAGDFRQAYTAFEAISDYSDSKAKMVTALSMGAKDAFAQMNLSRGMMFLGQLQELYEEKGETRKAEEIEDKLDSLRAIESCFGQAITSTLILRGDLSPYSNDHDYYIDCSMQFNSDGSCAFWVTSEYDLKQLPEYAGVRKGRWNPVTMTIEFDEPFIGGSWEIGTLTERTIESSEGWTKKLPCIYINSSDTDCAIRLELE